MPRLKIIGVIFKNVYISYEYNSRSHLEFIKSKKINLEFNQLSNF